MKIKVQKKSYKEVCEIPKPEHKNPKVSLPLMRFLMKMLGEGDLKDTDFSYSFKGIDGFPDEPSLILMNHSSFIDLEMTAKMLYPKPYAIVCTSDGFVGKEWLMRNLGCIPTNKFVTDATLMSDISYALKTNRTHVLMYPEASYSFDGRATALPRRMGVLLKLLKVPVVMIRTYGAFTRDPLYNMLKKRKVKVSAEVSLLASVDDIKAKTTDELDRILDDAFSFDNFTWQKENGIEINEDFRADGLERILYRCPVCGAEGKTEGKGTGFCCHACGAKFELSPLGEMVSDTGEVKFPHIPDWYEWERECVKKELSDGTYSLECDVDILVLRDYKAVYSIGSGHLSHGSEGFRLVSDDKTLDYSQKPSACYGLYADYFWYELGDIICIGNNDMLYYCFPKKEAGVPVAKTRLATEELYKMTRPERRKKAE